MLEFILKDDYAWDGYDYLVKIYNVTDKERTLNMIKDYIAFIKNYRDTFDDCLITYIRDFLNVNFKHDIQLLENIEKIDY